MTTLNKDIELNVVEARKKIGHILEDVYRNDQRYILKRRGQPYAQITRVNEHYRTPKSKLLMLADIARAAHKYKTKKVKINDVMQDIRE